MDCAPVFHGLFDWVGLVAVINYRAELELHGFVEGFLCCIAYKKCYPGNVLYYYGSTVQYCLPLRYLL